MFRQGRSPRDLHRLADEDLMGLAGEGQAGAFGIVFHRHGDAAFSLAYRMCGSRPRAEDIVQESFVSLWRRASRYDRVRGSVRSWVLSVVHNQAIDSFRSENVRAARELRDDGLAERVPAAERTETEVERRDDAEHVRSALLELPPDQLRVIELAYFGGFTHSQIAEMLELPAGTVKGRLRLGLSKLRLSLNGAGVLP
jgi:RNA polymerase sigma-70 factor (ECF subfamily)